jgi:predicted ferric reductase
MDRFKIHPGQFMIFRFLSPGYWYEAHPFSLSWVPEDGILRITPKAVGDFTRKIPQLEKNSPVFVDGPYGVFTKDAASSNKILLIAGGIGITPLRALAEQFAKQKKNVVLIYSNKTLKDIVFRKELDALSKKYQFPVHYIHTQEQKFKATGGRINAEMLHRFVPDIKERDAYICGPKPMIDGVRRVLHILGVPAARIHFEKFSMP